MTRGEVKIIDGETDLVNLYIHSAMYPSGVMREVAKKYCNYEEVDGIQMGKFNIYNGIGDFATQLITYLKETNAKNNDSVLNALRKVGIPKAEMNSEPGWIYVVPLKTQRNNIEYYYEITSQDNRLFIKCYDLNHLLFDGSFKEYLKWTTESEGE